MTKQDIIDYVTMTPHNSNKAVLSTMLDDFEVGDNKQEIEFLATKNGVFTPHEGKVFNKVTVKVEKLDPLVIRTTDTEDGKLITFLGSNTINTGVNFLGYRYDMNVMDFYYGYYDWVGGNKPMHIVVHARPEGKVYLWDAYKDGDRTFTLANANMHTYVEEQ